MIYSVNKASSPITVAAGASVPMPDVLLRRGSTITQSGNTFNLNAPGDYEVSFETNATAAGSLAFSVGGNVSVETTMTPVANGMASRTAVLTSTCRCPLMGGLTLSVVNSGDADITIVNPSILIKRLD
jgi:hypothetical protein